MRQEYAVHAGVYEDTWHDYETHKRRKIWRADWVRNNFFALRKY